MPRKKKHPGGKAVDEIRDQIRGIDMQVDDMIYEMNQLNDLLESFGEEREETSN